MPNYSTFIAPDYIIDELRFVYNLPANQYANAILLNQLRALTNPTSDQVAQINSLTITLQDYNVSPDQFNTFSQALISMEGLTKKLVNFEDQGEYSSLTTYDWWNSVTLNGQTYISKQDNNLNHTPVGGVSDVYWSLASKKGVSFRPLSTWSNLTSYVNNLDFIDVVISNGSAFYCKQSHTNQQPSQANPPVDNDYWGVLANRGIQGLQGTPGLDLQYRGTYDALRTYAVADAVNLGGSIYYCHTEPPMGTSPSDQDYWSIFMQRSPIQVSSTPPSSPSIDDVYINSTTLLFYRYNGSTWIALRTDTITDGTYTFTASDINTMQTNINENSLKITTLNGEIESINANIAENTIKINNHTKEIANLNLQLEASKRVVSGSTFGTDFAGIFNMTLDYAYTTTNQSLLAGVTDLSDKINAVNNGSFIINQRLTITDDVNNEEIIITNASPLTCTPLVNSYKKQALIGRSLVDSNTRNFIDYYEPNDNFLHSTLEKTDSVQLTCVEFSPDGTKVFCGGVSYLPSKLYDVVSGELLWSYTPTGNGAGVTCAKFSPDGTKIYVGTAGNTSSEAYIGEINALTGGLIRKTDVSVTSYVNDLDISPNGAQIAINGSNSGMVFNISDWSSVWTGIATNIKCCCYSKDGTKLAIGFASPYCIKIYNTSDWTLYSNFTTSYQVFDMEFFDNDTKILFCSTIAYVYNVTTNSLEHTFTESSIYSVATNEVDNTLAFCKGDGTNYFYSYPSYTSLGTYTILNGGTHGNMLSVSGDVKYFASVNQTTVGTVVRLTVLDTLQNTVKKLLNSVLRFTTQDAKEVVLWVDRDSGLTINSKINDMMMTKSTVNNQDQFIGELSNTAPIDVALSIIRDSTSNNGVISKILGGIL